MKPGNTRAEASAAIDTLREGERIRLRHAITRARAHIDVLETNLRASKDSPIGLGASEGMQSIASEITAIISRHDAYELAGRKL